MASVMACVRFVRSMLVEWFGLKPCCVGERVWGVNVVENQPLKYFRRVAQEGDLVVGGWFLVQWAIYWV